MNAPDPEPLLVGGAHLDRDAALEHARRYLTEGHGWGYPSYDGFDAAGAAGPLLDADLLAPLLLDVPWLTLSTYESLQALRPRLQDVLDRIPPGRSLLDAEPEQLDELHQMFGVLQGRGSGARGTVLSRLLHRKRPGFIPLYDSQVRHVYVHGPAAPIPAARDRPWRVFAPLFAAAVQTDLRRELPFWQQITDLAPGPPITPLRALHIVTWWAGRPDPKRANDHRG